MLKSVRRLRSPPRWQARGWRVPAVVREESQEECSIAGARASAGQQKRACIETCGMMLRFGAKRASRQLRSQSRCLSEQGLLQARAASREPAFRRRLAPCWRPRPEVSSLPHRNEFRSRSIPTPLRWRIHVGNTLWYNPMLGPVQLSAGRLVIRRTRGSGGNVIYLESQRDISPLSLRQLLHSIPP
ncbi:hypothetical protein BU26DRAFT_300239 [Trematosphaeria pertusa]|uniref:Uncharacterized protein n=1 Tax=Trematosphaeria pertusa TaxID=390896 RepID=A0A6A6IIE2_9PLEO|nr:uncharacterized protein BU26DRAFT_300239 [Trematosphaeria pertusa]KAF2250344.1 hypothetical protein BU26DRAFT_300239 [Trematosphaeria pertusa]